MATVRPETARTKKRRRNKVRWWIKQVIASAGACVERGVLTQADVQAVAQALVAIEERDCTPTHK